MTGWPMLDEDRGVGRLRPRLPLSDFSQPGGGGTGGQGLPCGVVEAKHWQTTPVCAVMVVIALSSRPGAAGLLR